MSSSAPCMYLYNKDVFNKCEKQTNKKQGFHAPINCMAVWLCPGLLWDSERLHGKKHPGPNTLEKCPISNSNQLLLTIVWNVCLTTTTNKGTISTGNETCHGSQSWFTWRVFFRFPLRIMSSWLMKVCFGSQEGLFFWYQCNTTYKDRFAAFSSLFTWRYLLRF